MDRSQIFRDMLFLGDGLSGAGLSDEHPIVLEGLDPAEFECLLDYLLNFEDL
jgi:hypothetical protein